MPSKNIKISILGGGLSSIYAYWGCLDAGYSPQEIEVLHDGFSKMPGAIFMYNCPVPWEQLKVNSVLLGTCEGYSLRQWGDETKITSAHKRFNNGSNHHVIEYLYNAEELFTTLWGMIPNISYIDRLEKPQITALQRNRKAVICTFPDATIRSRYVVTGYLQVFPVYTNQAKHDHCTVIYNGLQHIPWVRQTLLNGHIFTEYPRNTSPITINEYETSRGNTGGSIHMLPDLSPDCPSLSWEDRREDNLFRVGRFASFIPGYLSDIARDDTATFLGEL